MRSVRYSLACLLPLIIGSALYAAFADPALPIFGFEFAGSAQRAAELTHGREGAFSDALNADYAFLAGYAGTIVAACALALRRGAVRRGALWFGIGAGATAALFDVAENLLLARGLDGGGDGAFAGAAVAAGLKFALVIPAAVIAVWALTRRPPLRQPDAAGASAPG